jgi:hypothetical protein
MKYLIIALFLMLSGCGDPVNKAISEFKKTPLSKELNACGGLNGKFAYKVVKFNQLKVVDDINNPLNDEPVLVVEIVKELVKGKPVQINNIYRFNDQTLIFKKKSFYIAEQNLKYWKDEDFESYSYEMFCKDEPPLRNNKPSISESSLNKSTIDNSINQDKKPLSFNMINRKLLSEISLNEQIEFKDINLKIIADINGDGLDDYFVELVDGAHCGSGGCEYFAYISSGTNQFSKHELGTLRDLSLSLKKNLNMPILNAYVHGGECGLPGPSACIGELKWQGQKVSINNFKSQ